MKGRKSDAMKNVQTIETTVGELIEMISQIASEVGRDREESGELASLALQRILEANGKNIDSLVSL